MSYEEAFGPAEAQYKSEVMHDTWGHLYPSKVAYKGVIVVAVSLYPAHGGPVIISEVDLPDGSPWWYNAVTDFVYEACKDEAEGTVLELDVKVDIVDCEEELTEEEAKEYAEAELEPKQWQEIHITELNKTTLIEGASNDE